MTFTFKKLRKQDHRQAIQFAIKGMNFNRYVTQPLLLNLYGRYFWYLEFLRATDVIALYADEVLAGVLLAEITNEPRQNQSFFKKIYVKAFQFLQNLWGKNATGPYELANEKLKTSYLKNTTPNGEIIFLAANPDLKISGIGSRLLKEFERRHLGKEIFLFTDSGCTYQFYEKRGFQLAGAKEISLSFQNTRTSLTCMLFNKKIPRTISLKSK